MNYVCRCGAITSAGATCPGCLRGSGARTRVGAAARGYGHRWRTGLRRRQLSREPICQYVTPEGERCAHRATDVDHVLAKADGGPDHPDNLQSLCRPHHAMKTYRERKAREHGVVLR